MKKLLGWLALLLKPANGIVQMVLVVEIFVCVLIVLLSQNAATNLQMVLKAIPTIPVVIYLCINICTKKSEDKAAPEVKSPINTKEDTLSRKDGLPQN
jgi:hypothetical protein